MKDWLYPGAKVVCCDVAYPSDNPHGLHGLTRGRTYTVRAAGTDPFYGVLAVWLEEIVRPVVPGFEATGEVGFGVWRFRPLQKRKTDISVFTQLLTPSPREKADA